MTRIRVRAGVGLLCGVCSVTANADLASAFNGFRSINEVGVSGLRSSYHSDTRNQLSVTGPTISTVLPTLGPGRVTYPSVGPVPSPGGGVGRSFDWGMLGVRQFGNSLRIRVATAFDPRVGIYNATWDTWYGAGDMFITVQDSNGMSQFALLNTWARNSSGNPRTIGRSTFFNAAQSFHLGGGREGNLIHLTSNSHVTPFGGAGAYGVNNAPAGLDMRAFARGGTDLGDAGLTFSTVTDYGQTWYLGTWTIDLSDLSSDSSFSIALHAAPSCGNDQIGLTTVVPAPGAALLGGLGLLMVNALRRRVS